MTFYIILLKKKLNLIKTLHTCKLFSIMTEILYYARLFKKSF